jgi:hypothetical protein
VRPTPSGATGTSGEGLLPDFPSFHGTEYSKELIHLHLRARHVVEVMPGEGRCLLCHLRHPVPQGVGGDRKDPGHRADPEPFGYRARRPPQHLRRDPLAVERRALGL